MTEETTETMTEYTTEYRADDLTPASLEILLLEWWPVSDDEYAAAYRYQEFLYCMKELTKMFEERHKELIAVIRVEGLASAEFLLEIPADDVVNTDLLKDELPDIFDELVFIKASDAKRFIGLKSLYAISVETAGRDRVGKVERVNLQDLKKALPAGEAVRYVKKEPHESLTRVVRREGE